MGILPTHGEGRGEAEERGRRTPRHRGVAIDININHNRNLYYSYRGWWIGNKECNKENGRPGDGGGRFSKSKGARRKKQILEQSPRFCQEYFSGMTRSTSAYCAPLNGIVSLLFLRCLPIFFLTRSPNGRRICTR